jgi:hypothetical protein
MKLLRPYIHIKDFLYRYTILQLGSLHIRIHKLVDSDRSTLMHSHPFNYISIILRGGYLESVLEGKEIKTFAHGLLSVIKRNKNQFHRIDNLKGVTYTLFIAWGKYEWKAVNMLSDASDDGMYERIIHNNRVWSKKLAGIWYIGNKDKMIAEAETRHSIHQAQKEILYET